MFVEALAQSDVAVVEADDAKAGGDQQLDELVGPCDQLHAQAHDQQQRLAVRRAAIVDLDRDAVGLYPHAMLLRINAFGTPRASKGRQLHGSCARRSAMTR